MNLCKTLIWTTFNFFVNIYFAFQKFFFFERFNRFHIKLDFKVFQVWFVTLCRNLFICMFVLRLVAGCLLCCWKTSNIPQNKHCNCNLDKTPDTSHKLNCPVTRRKPSLIILLDTYDLILTQTFFFLARSPFSWSSISLIYSGPGQQGAWSFDGSPFCLRSHILQVINQLISHFKIIKSYWNFSVSFILPRRNLQHAGPSLTASGGGWWC